VRYHPSTVFFVLKLKIRGRYFSSTGTFPQRTLTLLLEALFGAMVVGSRRYDGYKSLHLNENPLAPRYSCKSQRRWISKRILRGQAGAELCYVDCLFLARTK
jgi:hypothetical protein